MESGRLRLETWLDFTRARSNTWYVEAPMESSQRDPNSYSKDQTRIKHRQASIALRARTHKWLCSFYSGKRDMPRSTRNSTLIYVPVQHFKKNVRSYAMQQDSTFFLISLFIPRPIMIDVSSISKQSITINRFHLWKRLMLRKLVVSTNTTKNFVSLQTFLFSNRHFVSL